MTQVDQSWVLFEASFQRNSTTTTTTTIATALHYTNFIAAHYNYKYNYNCNHITLHNTKLHWLHCVTLQLQLQLQLLHILHYTPLHYATLRYTTLHYATLITLHYTTTTTTLPYTRLHYTVPHYTTQHYTTLHCTARSRFHRGGNMSVDNFGDSAATGQKKTWLVVSLMCCRKEHECLLEPRCHDFLQKMGPGWRWVAE